MKSAMPPSGVPAFIATAPPTVAGTPTRHSMPPRFSAAASRIGAERLPPAPPPLAVKLGAAEAALELEHPAADAAVADQQVVAAADDVDRELLALRERQRAADVCHVLGDDEDVRRTSDAQGGMETERLLESDLAPDLSQHALSPLG